MARLMLTFSSEEIHCSIPYSMVCMARYGKDWNTMHRKRRWAVEFTKDERIAAKRLFSKAHDWSLGRGVPAEVTMSTETFRLWLKLGDFCASL